MSLHCGNNRCNKFYKIIDKLVNDAYKIVKRDDCTVVLSCK